MKNFIKLYLIVFICWVIITLMLYFGVAFSFYDLNAKNWSTDARDFVSMVSGFLFICTFVITGVWSSMYPTKSNS